MPSIETASVRALAPKTTEIRIRQFTIVQDKPADLGGTDRGPMASEYFLAAWGACMTTTFMRIATIRKVPFRGVKVDTAMEFDDRGEVTGLKLALEVESEAEEKAVDTAFHLASKSCTISRLIGDVPIEKRVSVKRPQ